MASERRRVVTVRGSRQLRRRSKPAGGDDHAATTLKIGIFVDDAGAAGRSGADEADEYEAVLRKWLRPARLTFYRPTRPLFEEGTDLLIFDFDFGGMASTYGSRTGSRTADNSRAVCRWAEDHPSTLIVIPASFTYETLILPELTELGLYDLPNIVLNTGLREYVDEPTLPKWWMDQWRRREARP